jgi:hypothetical protein
VQKGGKVQDVHDGGLAVTLPKEQEREVRRQPITIRQAPDGKKKSSLVFGRLQDFPCREHAENLRANDSYQANKVNEATSLRSQ